MNSIPSRQRQIQLFTPLLCAILGSAFGCFPGDISLTAGDGGGETSGVATTGDGPWLGDPVGWSEVQCAESSGGPAGLARVEGPTDAWVWVLHIDDLEIRGAEPDMVRVYEWPNDTCANGATPSTFFAEHYCLRNMSTGVTGCFVGDGEWFAAAVPSCDPELEAVGAKDVPAWPEWSCAFGFAAVVEPYDEATCTADELGCLGWTGNAALLINPPCEVESYPQLDLAACMP